MDFFSFIFGNCNFCNDKTSSRPVSPVIITRSAHTQSCTDWTPLSPIATTYIIPNKESFISMKAHHMFLSIPFVFVLPMITANRSNWFMKLGQFFVCMFLFSGYDRTQIAKGDNMLQRNLI